MSNKNLVAIATAAALAFSAVPVVSMAADEGVACYGVNGCKGQSACKSANNSCKGQNSCKGKGMIMESSADACTSAGGTS